MNVLSIVLLLWKSNSQDNLGDREPEETGHEKGREAELKVADATEGQTDETET